MSTISKLSGIITIAENPVDKRGKRTRCIDKRRREQNEFAHDNFEEYFRTISIKHESSNNICYNRMVL